MPDTDNENGNPKPTASEKSPSEPTISRVSVKVPPFWATQPQIWFAQIESQFDICGVSTDVTKFNTIVGNIESSVLTQVTDAVLTPPEKEKYEHLKKAIIECYSDSEQLRMRKLLSQVDLGDKKPSQLYNELRQLGGENINADFLKNIWLQRLPPPVQAILVTIKGDSSILTNVADSVMETGGYNRLQKISITAGTSASKTSNTPTTIEAKIDELTRRFDQLERSRSRSRSASNQRNNSTSREKSTFCWYHRRFGDKALKCNQPDCSFVNSKK